MYTAIRGILFPNEINMAEMLLKLKTENILIGDGFTKEGQFPFINEMDLKTFKTNRLYTSKSTTVKRILDVLDAKKVIFW